MRRAEKPDLLRWLYRFEFEGIVSFKSVLQRGAQAVLLKDALSAEAYAESNVTTVWNYVFRAQEDAERRGISPIFDVVDPVGLTVRRCSLASRREARRVARLRHRPAILRMIDGLTDREFEALGCTAFTLAGAAKVSLTPPRNEGGVDFFALLPFPARCHLFAGGVSPVRIVGQSKKYSTPVQVGRFKEFLKTIDEVKYGGEFRTEKVVPAWFRAVRGPIVGVMVAHTGFQSGVDSRARRHGVILADSLDMAEIVALSRCIPEDLAGSERAAKCLSRIRALLS